MTKLELTKEFAERNQVIPIAEDELEYMSSRTGIRYPEMRSKHEAIAADERRAVLVNAADLKELCDAIFMAREWINGDMLWYAVIQISPERTLGQYMDEAIKIATKVTP